MTTRRTEQDQRTEPDRRTETDVTYNEPYRRAQPESAYTTRRSSAAEAGASMAASQTPEMTTGRMSFADRISGGPIWAGFIIGFATWIFLEIVLVAAGRTVIRGGAGTTVNTADYWWSLGAGLIALFIGGLISGLASRWHTAGAGAMQGLTVWALSFVALLVLGAVGAGIGFGAFSDVVGVNGGLSGNSVPAETIQTARDAAGAAIALLVATAVLAVAGGILGAWLSGRARRRNQGRAQANAGNAAARA